MESLFIIPPLELSICNSLWKGLLIKLRSKDILSENGFEFLMAILLDKTQEAIDPESCPSVIHWLKRILPRILKHPGNISILNKFPKSLWQNDFELRCRYLLYLKCRALRSANQP
jgi:hypothetical protein